MSWVRSEALDPMWIARLQPLFGSALDLARVRIVRDWRLTPRAIDAFVLGGTVFFAPGAFQPEAPGGLELLVHELVHVRQWRALGGARFVTRYVLAYARGRWRGLSHHSAYRRIPLEREAFATASCFEERIRGGEMR